jgi:putative tricarboxylic transport membrane protein
MIMDSISGLLGGFAALANPETLLYMIGGFLIGTFFGAVPGLTSVLAIALLLPLTYSLDVTTALVACASIFMAGMCSGSITATTINIPGAPSSMMTALEGYPMQQRGEGAKALGHAALGSMIGGSLGALLLIQADSRSTRTVDPSMIQAAKVRRRDFIPPLSEVREIGVVRYLKSAVIGYAVGILPGAGGSMAAFVSYAESMRSSKHPERYGKGNPEGIAAAECANNSMCGGAFVPMLTFGIPGDPTTAIVLGVLVINGLQPGPQFMTQQLDLIAPMFASLFVSALILIPLTLYLLGPYFLKIVSIRRDVLYSSIAIVALVGSYVATYSTFQMALALVFGVLAYFLRKQKYPTVCLLLGFVLGPSLEEYCRRALSINDGNPLIFFTSPDSLFFIALTVVFFYFMVIRKPKDRGLGTRPA